MTTATFRRLALALPGAVESSHMGHPDFRIGGKIFATLGYPDDGYGMVKLNPQQQGEFVHGAPGVFTPCTGAWGRAGATAIQLDAAKAGMLRTALAAARQNISPPRATPTPARGKQTNSPPRIKAAAPARGALDTRANRGAARA